MASSGSLRNWCLHEYNEIDSNSKIEYFRIIFLRVMDICSDKMNRIASTFELLSILLWEVHYT